MSASSKLLRIVSQQRRMAALAYGQAITQKENLERVLQKKRTAIASSEQNLTAVMRSSRSNNTDANEPVQTMQALMFHQCELAGLNLLVEVTRKELANAEMQIRELRENYEVFHSREEALGILVQKDEQKRLAKRIHAEQTNLDEVTVQRWKNQTA